MVTYQVDCYETIDYEKVLALGKIALSNIQTENEIEEQTPEQQLLIILFNQLEYNPMTVEHFWQCPSFQQLIASAYPKVTSFPGLWTNSDLNEAEPEFVQSILRR